MEHICLVLPILPGKSEEARAFQTELDGPRKTEYDVSVLVLASPITSVVPRKVGSGCTFHGFARSTAVRLVGFGATDMEGRTGNTLLKEAMTEVTDPESTLVDSIGAERR